MWKALFFIMLCMKNVDLSFGAFKAFDKIKVEADSFYKDVIMNAGVIRNLIECSGYCVRDSNCSAFAWNVFNFNCITAIGKDMVKDNTTNGLEVYKDKAKPSVDSLWTEWGNWSPCNRTHQSRSRWCSNNPSFGGAWICPNNATDVMIQSCNISEFSKVLVALGTGIDGLDIADVEVIDLLSAGTTCQKPKNFPSNNSYVGGGLGLQEKPLICGSNNDNNATCYVYENGHWNISSYSLKQGRRYFAMTKSPFQDGSSKLFLTGGAYNSPKLSSSELLTANGWQLSFPLPVIVTLHCMVIVNFTSVMVIGGHQIDSSSGDSFLFNSVTNIWTEGPTLINSRYSHGCGSIRKSSQTEDKSLIVVGGDDLINVSSSVEVLDFDSNAWRRGPDLPILISSAALVEDPSGGVVLIGGMNSDLESPTYGETFDTLYRLHHAGPDATWELMTQKLKTARYAHTAFLIPDNIAVCN